MAMRKQTLLTAIGLSVWLLLCGIGGQRGRAQVLPVTPEQFSAIARAQLETLHYIAHVFRAKRGEYPKSLAELTGSPYCVVHLTNLYSGLPLQQIGFIPGPEDFATGEALPGGIEVPSLPPPPEEEGPSDETPSEEGETTPSSPGGEGEGTPPPLPSPSAGRRIKPARVPIPTPGDLIYWTEGNALQLVIFSDSGSWQELWTPRPYCYQADQLQITETTRPQADFLVAELAMHLERMLPGMIGRYMFLATDSAPSPRQLAQELSQKYSQYAATLCMTYVNPLKSRPLISASYYSPGDLAAAQWLPGSSELLYFLQGRRARSLDELTDAHTLRLHASEIVHRDQLIKAHAGDLPPPASGS